VRQSGAFLGFLEGVSSCSIAAMRRFKFKASTEVGFTKDQIRRAKYRIGIVARRQGFARDGWWSWRLPVHASDLDRQRLDEGRATP
jgi:hypothetical protein